jgi:hypothetical protein
MFIIKYYFPHAKILPTESTEKSPEAYQRVSLTKSVLWMSSTTVPRYLAVLCDSTRSAPTEQSVNVKWAVQEKSWVWVWSTYGDFFGIWGREKRNEY